MTSTVLLRPASWLTMPVAGAATFGTASSGCTALDTRTGKRTVNVVPTSFSLATVISPSIMRHSR